MAHQRRVGLDPFQQPRETGQSDLDRSPARGRQPEPVVHGLLQLHDAVGDVAYGVGDPQA
ncbi:hypothetical protein [Streptomyces iranensis]|uniref:hypothetical protein n=1 Tax=Streptomyces iranensis TaxID=576784 RepID=UPI0039B75FC6